VAVACPFGCHPRKGSAVAVAVVPTVDEEERIHYLCFRSFPRFQPKIACQVQKSLNPLQTNDIRVAYELGPNRYTEFRQIKERQCAQRVTY
jgi:hypothetical protein